MSAPMFLVAQLPPGGVVTLAGPEGHHAATVSRLRVGEAVLLSDGRGATATAVVIATDRGRIEAMIGEVRFQPAPKPRLVVVQGLAKGDRGELAVQAMTEVGVDVIVPWSASRSVVQWRDERGQRARQRWVDTAREAAKQARRAWLPEVTELESTGQVAARLIASAGAVVLHESADTGLTTVPLPIPDQADSSAAMREGGEITLVIGPEGGISPAELDLFCSSGALVARLGEAILRTSTAGVASLSVLNVRLRRW